MDERNQQVEGALVALAPFKWQSRDVGGVSRSVTILDLFLSIRVFTSRSRFPSRGCRYFDVAVGGSSFLSGFDSSERFAIAVAGDYAKFWLGDGQTQPAFVEQLTPSTYVAFGGAASAFVGASSSIATSVNGFIDYCVMKSATEFPVEGYRYNCAQEKALTHLRCESQEHRLTMTRR